MWIILILPIYFPLLGIFYSFYTKARTKLEESYKPFRGKSSEIPSKEQAKLLEKELQKDLLSLSCFNEERIKWFKTNLRHYRRIRFIMNILTFGIFSYFE